MIRSDFFCRVYVLFRLCKRFVNLISSLLMFLHIEDMIGIGNGIGVSCTYVDGPNQLCCSLPRFRVR